MMTINCHQMRMGEEAERVKYLLRPLLSRRKQKQQLEGDVKSMEVWGCFVLKTGDFRAYWSDN